MKRTTLLALGASVLAITVAQADDKSSEIQKVTVTGAGTATGSGYIVPEDAPKGRSTVTREGIENSPSTDNPYQYIDKLPGVNANSTDGTGLFGGAITMRGYNSQQIGFTIDGAPVNDSGNFEVFPQEYYDSENLEQVFVTQGSADFDAPHVGASGGNIGIVSSNPTDQQRLRYVQVGGQLDSSKEFFRFDTGLYDGFKAYGSYSQANADKFKGPGSADKENIDGKFVYMTSGGSSYSAGAAWNRAINTFYYTLSKANIAAVGTSADYLTTFGNLANPIPAPGSVGFNEGAPPNDGAGLNPYTGYFGLHVNPFENMIANVKADMQMTNAWRLNIEPYFWYGNGGGSTGAFVSDGCAKKNGAGKCLFMPITSDYIGGSGNNLAYYRNSTTETYRPGVTVKSDITIDDMWRLSFGGWYERARHRQLQPFEALDANGNPFDQWSHNELLSVQLPGDGSQLLEGRNQYTISTGYQEFANLTGQFFSDALKVNLGFRNPTEHRDITFVDFTNATSDCSSSACTAANHVSIPTVHLTKEYTSFLPAVSSSYQLSPESQVFADVAKTFKAPPNFVLTDPGQGANVVAETAWDYELGYRYQDKFVTAAITGFVNNFSNRLFTINDPVAITSRTQNIGAVDSKGIEAELGTAPWHGFTLYTSATYLHSELQDDLRLFEKTCANATCSSTNSNVVVTIPTKGRQMVDSPEFMAAASLGYAVDGFFFGVTPKWRSKQYSSLTNDESYDAYTTIDLVAGYHFPDISFFKNMTLQLNVNNLFDEHYLFVQESGTFNAARVAPVGSGLDCSPSSANFTGCVTPSGTPFYFVGSPVYVGAKLSVDLN